MATRHIPRPPVPNITRRYNDHDLPQIDFTGILTDMIIKESLIINNKRNVNKIKKYIKSII